MRAIPLARCVFLVPFISILDEAGAPTRSLLAKFHLPTYPEEKPNLYMPLFPALRFATTAQGTQGIEDFGFYAGTRLGFAALSESFQALARRSPTLFAALKSWCRSVQLEDTFLRFWLERHGDSVRICSVNMVPRAAEVAHFEHSQWLQNMMTICIVRQFAGPDWMPAHFAFHARYTPSIKTQSLWPHTRFLCGEKSSWIDVPVSALSLPNPARSRARSQLQIDGYRLINTDTISTLKMMLAAYLDGRIPNVEDVAEIAGTSVRSLQREFSVANLTFTRLLEQVRFEKAADMLRQSDVKVIDVAYATGYSDPAHFARAFRRIAGVTPREFRDQQMAH